jgi:hypothetical protein
MNKIKVQSTCFPKKTKLSHVKNITLGSMINFWNKDGHFNLNLYEKISRIKTNEIIN